MPGDSTDDLDGSLEHEDTEPNDGHAPFGPPVPIQGEDTRAFIVSAGIHRQKSRSVLAILAIGLGAAAFVTFLVLEAMGTIDVVPVRDETAARDDDNDENDAYPADANGDPKLRDQLLGLNRKATSPPAPAPRKNPGELDARSLFEDEDKKPSRLNLSAREVRAKIALPDGLTGEAIATVVAENSGAARLCIAEALRAGETQSGRAEFSVTISGSGDVTDVDTETAAFNGSRLSRCMEKTIARWRFPRFDGAPFVVVIPYVITEGF